MSDASWPLSAAIEVNFMADLPPLLLEWSGSGWLNGGGKRGAAEALVLGDDEVLVLVQESRSHCHLARSGSG